MKLQILNSLFSTFNFTIFWWAAGAYTTFFSYVFIRFFVSRDLTYLYYSIYIFLSAVFCFCQNEVYLTDFFGAEYQGLSHRIICTRLLFPLMTACYIIFIGNFVNRKDKMPFTYKLLNFTVGFYLTYAAIMLFFIVHAYTNTFDTFHYLGFLGAFILIPPLYYETRKQFDFIIGFVIIGSLILYFGTIQFALAEHDIFLFIGIEPLHLMLFCMLTEIAIFLMGLGYKERLIRDNLRENQEENIIHLQEITRIQAVKEIEIRRELEKQTKLIEEQKKNEMEVQFDKEINELKIKVLRSQMNPHFLFNSLNTLKLMVLQQDLDKIEAYFNNFTTLLRRILEHSRAHKITLADELNTLELYIALERERFSLDLKFKLNIEDDIATNLIEIPPMLLQPLIESAIWYGLLPLKSKVPSLQVNVMKTEDVLTVKIIDNGIGREKNNTDIQDLKVEERVALLLKQNPDCSINIDTNDLVNTQGDTIGTIVDLTINI